MEIQLPSLHCLRCRHGWVPRSRSVLICPRCKSRLWNVPPPVRERASMRTARGTQRRERLAELRGMRREILRIARARGVTRLRVFGSVARGEESTRSDVDLLVDMRPGHSLLDRAGLKVELEELLGSPVDVVTEGNLYAPIRPRVLAEAVDL